MKNTLKNLLCASAALITLSACATILPNQSIADAQLRLSNDYNDKKIAERGQGDLANAKTALGLAQSEWADGHQNASNHQLFMAQTYLDLAETRGNQGKTEAANALLLSQGQMAQNNRTIAGKNSQLDSLDSQLNTKNDELNSKDQQLAAAQAQLRDYDMKTTELGSTMVLQDVSFETGRSSLLPGGINRLQPLINYLKLSPNTRVRVEGYTDNVGGASYNMSLSLARANSVKSTMAEAGIDGNRIETNGSGYDKPIASNKTISGRQSNRRVEITLLKQPGM